MKLVFAIVLLASALTIDVASSEPKEGSFEQFSAIVERIVHKDFLATSANFLVIPKHEKEREEVETFIVDLLGQNQLEKMRENANHPGPMNEWLWEGMMRFGRSEKAKFKQTDPRFDQVDRTLIELYDQMTWAVDRLRTIRKDFKYETNFKKFFETIDKMRSLFHELYFIVFQEESKEVLLQTIREFTSRYERENFEFKVVDAALTNYGIIKSLAESYKRSVLNYQVESVASTVNKKNISPVASSTNKLIFEFYLMILMRVFEGFSMLQFCYQLQDNPSHSNSSRNAEFLAERKAAVISRLHAAMRDALSDTSVEVFYDLKTINQVKLSNVLQFYWAGEKELGDTCKKTCEDYQSADVNSENGCFGSARSCTTMLSLGDTITTYRKKDQDQRIYEGFQHGFYEPRGSIITVDYGTIPSRDDNSIQILKRHRSYSFPIYECDLCACYCDQTKHQNSVRKFYTGKIKAPDGFVVTGLRFAEKNRIIFVQIEVAKLLPLGHTNLNTLHWQDLPDVGSNNCTDCYEFGFNKQVLVLGETITDRLLLRGVQFHAENNELHLNGYFEPYKSLNLGLMSNRTKYTRSVDKENKNSKDLTQKIPGLDSSSDVFTITKNTKIKFGTSNEKSDAGQNFVPYFDGNAVSQKAPLTGLGLFHYTNNDDYAGYIKPYLTTLNYNRLFNDS